MTIQSSELKIEYRENMRGGEGTVEIAHAASPEMLPPGLRLHARLTLPPGASIGEHVHENETELFYVLQGQGELLENGTWAPLSPGDATSTGNGASHALRNSGDVPFVVMATIILA